MYLVLIKPLDSFIFGTKGLKCDGKQCTEQMLPGKVGFKPCLMPGYFPFCDCKIVVGGLHAVGQGGGQ